VGVPHVELSLSDPSDANRGGHARPTFDGSLQLWAFAVGLADEPCLLLDAKGLVVAVSPGGAALLAIDAAAAVNRPLVDGVLRFRDFNAVSGDLPGWDVNKIPPLLAIASQGLARGLLRVSGYDGTTTTVDAISTPLRQGDEVVGSLTFLAPVGR
jgi:hypothetical protein